MITFCYEIFAQKIQEQSTIINLFQNQELELQYDNIHSLLLEIFFLVIAIGGRF